MSADRSAVAHVGSWTVAAGGTVPGDVADVVLHERRDSAYRAQLLTLIRPSPIRVRPLCPIFERCGGCQWQRLDAAAQAEYKGALVRRALEARGLNQIPIETVPAASGWGYRTAGTYVPVAGADGPALGLHAPAGSSKAAIDRCPIQSPALQTVFEEMQRAWRVLAQELKGTARGETLCRQVRIRVGEASQEAAIGLVLGGNPTPRQRDAIVDVIRAHVTRVVEIAARPARPVPRFSNRMSELRWGRAGVVETLLGHWYHVPVFAPFPVAGRAASAAIASALEALALDEDATLLETDAGIGAYTLPAAAAAGRVIGRTAQEHLGLARDNAAWNDVPNAVFAERSAQTLAGLIRSYGPVRRALVQLTRDTVPFDALHDAGVQRLVLLANSPARLAEAFVAAGAAGFHAQSVTVIDTHPQTSRAEIHAVLDARRGTRPGA